MEESTAPANGPRSAMRGGLALVLVFLAAVLIRYVFVEQLREHSYLGNIRVSDARSYYQIAREWLEGTLAFEPYWQAPLYPLFLAGFQATFGNNLHVVQLFHIGIGALNCALVFRLATQWFGERAGWITGGIAVAYAPFWIFDAQPLPANVTVLLDLLTVMAYLRFRERGGLGWLALSGLLLGAAVITHGLAILTVPVFIHDLVKRSGLAGRSLIRPLAVFLAVVSLAPLAVSVRNSLAAGEWLFISYNAGINLYVGNHRDLDETLGRRGGFEWGEIFREPYTNGIEEPAELNRYFVQRALEEWKQAPLALLGTTLRKALISISGHEPKRNFPIYPLREESALLRVSLFEVSAGGWTVFAFPGGLVIPLVFFGVAAVFRGAAGAEDRVGLAARVALAHVVGMILFFPTARYRMPALFLLLPYAGWMASVLWHRIVDDESAKVTLRGTVLALLAFLVVNVVSPNVFRQPVEDRAAHLYSSALWAKEKLRYVESAALEAWLVAQAETAIAIDPAYPDPVGLLAVHYLDRDIDRSLAYFARLAELVPGDQDVQRQLREALAIRDAAR